MTALLKKKSLLMYQGIAWRSQSLEDAKHSMARLADGLQRDSPRERDSAPFGHIDLGAADRVPVEALDQRPQDQPQRPQREGLSGAFPPSHPERHHEQPVGTAVLEPLRPERGWVRPYRGVPKF
ncbi:hypothetical protein ZEAMMB73_Zm00001d034103 [Zea mays]|uniref:Uncharacterized protein n=1 Tax=Zea mays TaxID=4577 RepID=A0A1D6L5H9_MAIZE|nr:hypothetical protein ZEAMMB73_Zm00001d034103 [Zea mays]